MFLFEKAFLYFFVQGSTPELVEFYTDIKLEFISNNQIESSLKKEFQGIDSPPRALRVTFTRLIPHQPNPNQTEEATLNLDVPVFALKRDPPNVNPLHKAFFDRKRVGLAISLGDGTQVVTNGFIVESTYEQAADGHLKNSMVFVGTANNWQPASGNKAI